MLQALYPLPFWSAMNALKAVPCSFLSSHAKAFARSSTVFGLTSQLPQVYVLLEHTGHYHRAVVQFLQELDISVYLMPVQKRLEGMIKTDKRDALGLANHLFNQLEKGVQFADKTHLVRRLLPSTETALQLRGWTRHRYELS